MAFDPDRAVLDSVFDALCSKAKATSKAQVSAMETSPGAFRLFAVVPMSRSVAWKTAGWHSATRKLQDAIYDAVAEVYGSEQYVDLQGSKINAVQESHAFLLAFKINRSTENVDALMKSFEKRANLALNG